MITNGNISATREYFLFPCIIYKIVYIICWYSSICKYILWLCQCEGDRGSTTGQSAVIFPSESSDSNSRSRTPLSVCQGSSLHPPSQYLGLGKMFLNFLKAVVLKGRQSYILPGNRKVSLTSRYSSSRFMTSHLPKLIRSVLHCLQMMMMNCMY